MVHTEKMKGLFPAPVTPYKSDGSINPGLLETLMRRNITEGASGFFAGGSSAECFLLTESERIAVFEAACALGKETTIIAHVGAVSTGEAIRYAKAAKGFGAQYISAIPPFYYGFSNRQIARFFYDVANAVNMPLMIYNFPGNTGKSFNLKDPDIRGLICSDAVWGIKHTDYNLFQLERIRSLNPKLVIMNGYDETMTAGLALGAVGSVGSTFNVMLPHYMKIYNACRQGQGEQKKAMILQEKANNIMEAFCNAGLISSIKYVLTCQGIDVGIPRKPFEPLTHEQKEYIDEVLEQNLETGGLENES